MNHFFKLSLKTVRDAVAVSALRAALDGLEKCRAANVAKQFTSRGRLLPKIPKHVEFVGDDHVGVRIQECAEERGAATWITDEETKSLRVLKIEIHPKPFQQRR